MLKLSIFYQRGTVRPRGENGAKGHIYMWVFFPRFCNVCTGRENSEVSVSFLPVGVTMENLQSVVLCSGAPVLKFHRFIHMLHYSY